MDLFDTRDRRTRRPWAPIREQAPRLLQPVRAQIRPQQCGFDQVHLCPATAHTLSRRQDRHDQVDGSGMIAPLERGEGARHSGYDGAGGITAGTLQILNGLEPGLKRRVVTGGSMS